MRKITYTIIICFLLAHPMLAQNIDVNLLKQIKEEVDLLSDKIVGHTSRIDSIDQVCKMIQFDLKQNKKSISRLNINSSGLSITTNSHSTKLDSLCKELTTMKDSLTLINNNICTLDYGLTQVSENTESSVKTIKKNTTTVFVIISIILAAVTIVLIVYIRHLKSGKQSLDSMKDYQKILECANAELQKVQSQIQEKQIEIDGKLLEILNKQLETLTLEPKESDENHSFALKVADEIVRIENCLSKMDDGIKIGKPYKHLEKSVGRMKDNFNANGYEIVDLLGQEYKDGMQLIATFVTEESIPEGKRIITGINKLQINYNGRMIQPADVVVSQNI